MTYTETLRFLFSQLPMYQRQGTAAYKADLNNTIALCNAFNNPQNNFKCIHVAGTNGKGSVSHMLAAIFQKAGYKTGLYTSPHYKDFRERIKVNGKMPSKNYVIQFVAKSEKIIKKIQPSFFEMTVAMAFDYFEYKKVDIAIIEVGMGGRLDSTNVITPELSIITNITLDHTAFLGNTITKIAHEKAGIIKKNVPVVIGRYQPSIADVFKKRAMQCRSKIYFATKTVLVVKKKKQSPGLLTVDLNTMAGLVLKNLKIPLPGDYQLENIKTVVAAFEQLQKLGFDLKPVHLKSGLEQVRLLTRMPGRFEILSEHPKIIVDGAHNDDGLQRLMKQLTEIKKDKFRVVLGFVNDKDVDAALRHFPKNAVYYFCAAKIPRALPAESLQITADKAGLSGKSYSSVKRAFGAARLESGKNDLILVGGSIFVAAEVL